MTILEKTKNYYQENSSNLNSFLEKTVFLDTNSKYQNSVVIQFGIEKIIGEISVWQNEIESYIECEYLNQQKAENKPFYVHKIVNTESVIQELKTLFEMLRNQRVSNCL